MRGTPLPPGCYLGGLAAHAVVNTVVQVAIVLVAGKVLFNVDGLRNPVELVVFLTLGVVCFASLGVAFSHVIPNSESAPAYVNAVFLPVIFISGVFYDAAHAPAFLRDIAEILPLTHLIDGLSGAMVTGAGLADHAGNLAVLAVWAVFGVAFAIRGFSWEARRS
jgi:ABC-2 type transport system permease protein